MTDPLPYHCPTLKADYFKSPCEAQVAASQARQDKFPHAVMRYGLEQCLKCKGAALVKREGAIAQATIRENRIVQEEKPKMEIANEVAPEPQTPFPPRCPKHPEEPQVQCGPDSKRAGQYLGACKACMAERKVGRKPNMSKEKMTPAVARDLGIVPAPPVPPVRQNTPAESEIDAQPAPVVTYPLSAFADEIPTCPRPDCEAPGSPVKIDRLGRNMGMCVACISARGRKAGINNHERGLTAPPVSIPLNLAKYSEIKAWLEAQAEENERTLQAEIIFRLKLSMRAGG
jgi:hypothetical protein